MKTVKRKSCPLTKEPCQETCTWFRDPDPDEPEFCQCSLLHVLREITEGTLEVFAETVRT